MRIPLASMNSNSWWQLAIYVGCVILLGCQPRAAKAPAKASPEFVSADLDFRVPPFDARIRVQLFGEGRVPITDAELLLVLKDLQANQSRVIYPSGFDSDSWTMETDVQTDSIRYGRQILPLGESSPITLRHAKTGFVKLVLDRSVADIEAQELLLDATGELGVSGHWSILRPEPGRHLVKLPVGNLFINSFCNNERGLLFARPQGPYLVKDDQTLEVSVSATKGCKVFGRLVSTDGNVEDPIIGAQLTMFAEDSIQKTHRMVTNERGEFATRIAPGAFTISYVQLPETILFLENAYEGMVIDAQQELDIGTLALPRLFSVRGEVVNAEGNPLVFAQVSCGVGGELVGGGRTDVAGKFTAITASEVVDEYNVWPYDVFGRFEAIVEQARPLKLQVR